METFDDLNSKRKGGKITNYHNSVLKPSTSTKVRTLMESDNGHQVRSVIVVMMKDDNLGGRIWLGTDLRMAVTNLFQIIRI